MAVVLSWLLVLPAWGARPAKIRAGAEKLALGTPVTCKLKGETVHGLLRAVTVDGIILETVRQDGTPQQRSWRYEEICSLKAHGTNQGRDALAAFGAFYLVLVLIFAVATAAAGGGR
jgi:hypothetical protein